MTEALSVSDDAFWWGEPDYPNAGWVRSPWLDALQTAVKNFGIQMQPMRESLHAVGRAIDVAVNPHQNHIHIDLTKTKGR